MSCAIMKIQVNLWHHKKKQMNCTVSMMIY
jgi:hypothetical protein